MRISKLLIRRVAAMSGLYVFLIGLLLVVYVNSLFAREIKEVSEAEVRTIEHIVEQYYGVGDLVNLRIGLNAFAKRESIVEAELTNVDGQVIWSLQSQVSSVSQSADWDLFRYFFLANGDSNESVLQRSVIKNWKGEDICTVSWKRSLNHEWAEHRRQLGVFALAILASWLLYLAILRHVATKTLSPMHQMSERVRGIGNSISLTLLDDRGEDEIQMTTRWFRELADAWEEESKRAIEAQKAEAIARTTQMLAHDVRKPFSMLRVGLAMLGKAKDPESVKRVMSRVVPEIDRAMISVDGMLADVMEVGSTSVKLIPEPVSPESLFESTLGDVIRMYPEADISLSYDLNHTHMANVHIQKISRVFSNIVGNSFEAMRYRGSMWFGTFESEGMIRFCIGNDGSWIHAENLPNLFDAFFTSGKKGGTGLGLAIAQKVVNAHGGRIWCESSKTPEYPEGKVEFFFTLRVSNQVNSATANLPKHSSDIAKQLTLLTETNLSSTSMDRGELSLEEDIVAAHLSIGRALQVLIVDDESIYRSALVSHMTRTPELSKALVLTQADSSTGALQAVGDQEYDLIITDVDMGKMSLNGFELVTELRGRGSKALICVHSNRIIAADNKTAIESGADSFIPKPMAHAQLLRLLLQAASAR
ncbi:MAG: hybrid sensor histidine kinase/response regulator [Pseudomonadota bacterium]